MTDTSQARATIAERIWIVIRFIVFGIGGFLTIWISWLSLLFAFDPPGERLLSPSIAIPLSLVGAVMMLYGGGQWGRWAYLWVFVSVPVIVTLLGLIAGKYPRFDFLFAKPVLLVLIALPMPVSYALVRGYYRRREAEETKEST